MLSVWVNTYFKNRRLKKCTHPPEPFTPSRIQNVPTYTPCDILLYYLFFFVLSIHFKFIANFGCADKKNDRFILYEVEDTCILKNRFFFFFFLTTASIYDTEY